jgi:PKD repeat protein
MSSSGGTTPFDMAVTSSSTTMPVVNFTADNQVICAGDPVNFADQSSPCVTSWNWSFPGGMPSTSTSQFPNVVYTTTGQYNVTLTTTNTAGTNTATKIKFITVK